MATAAEHVSARGWPIARGVPLLGDTSLRQLASHYCSSRTSYVVPSAARGSLDRLPFGLGSLRGACCG